MLARSLDQNAPKDPAAAKTSTKTNPVADPVGAFNASVGTLPAAGWVTSYMIRMQAVVGNRALDEALSKRRAPASLQRTSAAQSTAPVSATPDWDGTATVPFAAREAVDRILQLPGTDLSEDPPNAVKWIFQAVGSLDLNNFDNLHPIIDAVRQRFSGEVLVEFLSQGQTRFPLGLRAEHHDERRRERYVERGLGPPRTKAGGYGPGLFVPLAGAASSYPAASAWGFLTGLERGFKQVVSDKDLDAFSKRMAWSTIYIEALSPVFLAGTVVGVKDQVVDLVKALFGGEFGEMAESAIEAAKAIFSPEGGEYGASAGEAIGRTIGAEVITLTGEDVFRFVYDLGKLVGPAILYLVLALTGVGSALLAAIAEKAREIGLALLALRDISGLVGGIVSTSGEAVAEVGAANQAVVTAGVTTAAGYGSEAVTAAAAGGGSIGGAIRSVDLAEQTISALEDQLGMSRQAFGFIGTAAKSPDGRVLRALDQYRAIRQPMPEPPIGDLPPAARNAAITGTIREMLEETVTNLIKNPNTVFNHKLTAGGFREILTTQELLPGSGEAGWGGGDKVRALVGSVSGTADSPIIEFRTPMKGQLDRTLWGDGVAWREPVPIQIVRIILPDGSLAEPLGADRFLLTPVEGMPREITVDELVKLGSTPPAP